MNTKKIFSRTIAYTGLFLLPLIALQGQSVDVKMDVESAQSHRQLSLDASEQALSNIQKMLNAKEMAEVKGSAKILRKSRTLRD